MLANGTATFVSATQHPDLFWALRGAGPGFAVVTTFHFQTLPAPPVNINWNYAYNFTTADTAAAAFLFATDWALRKAPKELGFGIYLGPAGVFIVRGVYYGRRAVFDGLIAPLVQGMQRFGTPDVAVSELGWIDSLTLLAGAPLVTPPEGDDKHDTFVSPPLSPSGQS